MSDETNEYYMRCVRVNQGAKGETEYFVKVDMEEHDAKVRANAFKLVADTFGRDRMIIASKDYFNNWVKEQEESK